ncbi:hypothetical protein [Fischerella sp. PCC 9605]|uniref:hypothetical protein n=1 Tax=Fischerella sp. PCC 9605 TaxID=1173024 RepID=UPI00047E6EE1|nr:hypothetical protein [Fischerella sp. PCC 9605]
MDLEMVLNELSLRTPAADISTAQRLMSELIKTLRQATTSGVKRVLRTQSDINTIELAPGYPLARWRNDPEVDREERSFFRTLTAKAPFWTDIAEVIKNDFDLSEFMHQGQQAIGLGFALVSDTLPVSLLSEDCWDYNRLQIEFRRIDENSEIVEEIVEIIHASRRNHVQEHTNWIQERICKCVSDGVELWSRREEFFPNLEFCDVVGKQLQNILTGQLELQPVINTLFALQNCCKSWQTGSFSVEGYSIDESGESEATLNKYGKERTFRCPDGQDRLFERHVKLRFCNWRIHFFPVKPGKLMIGYVGRHLSTVKYRT